MPSSRRAVPACHQRRVVQGREQKDDAGLVQHLGLPLRAQIEHHPQCLEHVRGAARRGRGRLPCLTTLAPAPAAATAHGRNVDRVRRFSLKPPRPPLPRWAGRSAWRGPAWPRPSPRSRRPSRPSHGERPESRPSAREWRCRPGSHPLAQPAASADRFSREISPVSTSGQVYRSRPPGRAGHAATLPPPPAVAPRSTGYLTRHRRATR